MYDRSVQKDNTRGTVRNAHRYLMHYKNSIISNSPYRDSFKTSLRSNISCAIRYLNSLL